jgi:hypothetical protein
MAVAMVLATSAAAYLFFAANPSTPSSDFHGTISVEIGGGAESVDVPNLKANVIVLVPDWQNLSQLARFQKATYIVEFDDDWFSNRTLYINSQDDAVLANVRMHVMDSNGIEKDVFFIKDDHRVSQENPAQTLAVTIPKGTHRVTVNGAWARPIGELKGATADLRFPFCAASPKNFHPCVIEAGQLRPGLSLSGSSFRTSYPYVLTWRDPGFKEPPYAQVIDDSIESRQNSYLFIAGALVGIAGSALIELLLIAAASGIFGHLKAARGESEQPERHPYAHLTTWYVGIKSGPCQAHDCKSPDAEDSARNRVG